MSCGGAEEFPIELHGGAGSSTKNAEGECGDVVDQASSFAASLAK
jgi:hypothetical protein